MRDLVFCNRYIWFTEITVFEDNNTPRFKLIKNIIEEYILKKYYLYKIGSVVFFTHSIAWKLEENFLFKHSPEKESWTLMQFCKA